MSPGSARKGARTYCYYTSRTRPGESRDKLWRFPISEIDPVVIEAIARHLEQSATSGTDNSADWQNHSEANSEMVATLRKSSTIEQREQLLKLKTSIQLNESVIDVTITDPGNNEPTIISVPMKLVRKGHELKIALSPDNRSPATSPDPVLVKLLGQAFAARQHLVEGQARKTVSDYSRRHLQKLARLSWLAPDIVSDILEGRQPPNLTARYLLRCGDVPLDWPGQREFLGFS